MKRPVFQREILILRQPELMKIRYNQFMSQTDFADESCGGRDETEKKPEHRKFEFVSLTQKPNAGFIQLGPLHGSVSELRRFRISNRIGRSPQFGDTTG